ncbi:hypothetical protein [Thauera aminoaromatica]|uniref:hypothetical protein n=1 Tax=Thauera aminoaromatica TaxID=164330 RepID=UPI001B7F7DAE|nr:hypothetical protein [Thauera aminoaromatica]
MSTVEPNPWSADTLLAKAQLYIEQMDSTVADEWKYGLWSALTLELLARAALANISPVLLADPQNWRNIMHALGNAPTAKKFSPTSIGTKEVLVRLSELLPEFNQEVAGFCGKHVERRNAELHSGEVVFTGVGTAEWLPRFYRAVKILLESMAKELADFVADPERALEMIASLDDAAAKAVDQDIKAHEKVWFNKPVADRDAATLQATAWATRHAGHRVVCPSCASPAILHGRASGPVSTTVGNDEVVQRQTMLPSAFECIACGLKIAGYSKLSACGLGDAFSEMTTYTAAEFFDLYTEDDLEEARNVRPEYEPDFNEY